MRRRLDRKKGAFDLGRFELPVAIGALVWSVVALFVLVAPAAARVPVLIVVGLLLVGGLFFLGAVMFNRQALETEPGDAEMSSSTDRRGEPMSTTTAKLTGAVVRPGDSGYEAARIGYNRLYTSQPEAIVFCTGTDDVVNALAWARRSDVPVRIRSGRHCLEGWSAVDDGLVIDVSEMKSAEIDAASRTATVGAGLNQMEAVTALGKPGFVAPTGIEGTVGLVGATLGGGFGLLTRRFGMASDNLVAAEVVVATAGGGAAAVIADEQTNQICCGRCAAQATAISGSSRHSPTRSIH